MADEVKLKITAEDDSGPAFKSAKKSLDDLASTAGVSAKQTAAAMRMVPAQLTDIVTSLQGGQAPLTVLIQQGGQLKDMFGGVVPAAKALGGYIFEMVNPLTLAAAAAAGLFVAFEQGRQESVEFNKQLALTGGYAGLSASQLAVMAAAMSKSNGTQHEAADVLAALVATGKVAGDQFGVIGEAVLAMSRATGIAVKDIVADFVALGDEPVKASAKLNETHHYLTEAIYEQIKALDDQGQKAQAAALAQTTYANAMTGAAGQVKEQLGILQRAWRQLAQDAKGAWDFMLNIGRPTTEQQELTNLEASIAAADGRRSGKATRSTMSDADLAAARERAAVLRARIKGQANIAAQQAEDAQGQEKAIAAFDSVTAWQDKAKGISAVNRELEKYRASLEVLRQRNPNSEALTPAAIAAGEAAIRKSFQGSQQKPTEYKLDGELEELKGKTQGIERDLKVSLTGIKNAYEQGAISAKEQLAQQYDARQDALAAELRIAKQQEELAAGKKNVAALERYKNDRRRIEDEITANAVEYVGAITTLQVKIERAVTEYRRSLDAAYATRQQSMGDQLQSSGLGARAAEELQRMTELRREVDRRREELVRDRSRNQIGEDQYQQELAALGAYWVERMRQEQDFNAKSAALRQDWTVGAAGAVATYRESATDIASQMNHVWTNAFSGMEDALVSFAQTGKFNFKSLADSIIADMLRIQVRASLTQLMGGSNWLTGVLGTAAGSINSATYGASGLGAATAADVAAAGDGLMFLADGGYTGNGAKFEPAGIVHKGEFVINAASTRAIGIDRLARLNQYASGGLVGSSASKSGIGAAANTAGGPAQQIVFAPVNHVTVGERDDRGTILADMQRMLAANNKGQLENLKRLGVIPA